MSFNLLTNDALSTINPADVFSYLKSTGWEMIPVKGINYTGVSYTKSVGNKDFDIFIPKNITYSDYLKRVKEFLNELQKVENRTVEKIFFDIKYTSYDVVRFRVIHPLCASGELPLDGNSKLIEGAKEVMATSAQSLDERKSYFPRRSAIANDYLKKVHVAQSEIGSYILKVTVPIPPTQLLPLAPNEDLRNVTDPFERSVTKHMMMSLGNCIEATDLSILNGNIDALTTRFDLGVNANILYALGKMGEIFDSNDIEITTTWSGNRPTPANVPRRAYVGRDYIQFIKEAARVLKESSMIEDFELVGHVVKLEGTQGAQDAGKVTVSGIVDGVMKNVKINLNQVDHASAHIAYGEKLTVRCLGELRRDGRGLALDNPRGFMVLEELDLEQNN